jgi:hypothetical protein
MPARVGLLAVGQEGSESTSLSSGLESRFGLNGMRSRRRRLPFDDRGNRKKWVSRRLVAYQACKAAKSAYQDAFCVLRKKGRSVPFLRGRFSAVAVGTSCGGRALADPAE